MFYFRVSEGTPNPGIGKNGINFIDTIREIIPAKEMVLVLRDFKEVPII